MRFLTLFCFSLLFFSLSAQNWQQLNDYPSNGVDDGMAFVIGDKAYCGTGIVDWFASQRDFYAFDLNTESWTAIAFLPLGGERQYANGFASDSFGYVFGGYNGKFLNDLWRYDSHNDQWQEMTPLPDSGRSGAASFVVDSMAYIIGGKNDSSQALSEVWAYNMNNDSWVKKSDLSFGSRWRSAATSNDSLGFLAFGMDDTLRYCQELFEYNPQTDSWSKLSDFPHGGRNYVKMHLINGKLVAFGGEDSNNTFLNELWSYDLQTNSWEELNPLPEEGRRGGMSFQFKNAFYYTTGLIKNEGRTKESWKYEEPTSLKENGWVPKIKLYPNPVQTVLTIEHPTLVANEQWQFELRSSKGLLLKNQQMYGSITRIQMESLSQGMYFLIIRSEKGNFWKKALKLD